MRRIIDGRRYDTATSEKITSSGNDYPINDFRHYDETLYRTPRGQYFIVAEGGPLSPAAHQVGGSRVGGETMRLMDIDEVRAWLERHEKFGELERIFGDSITDG